MCSGDDPDKITYRLEDMLGDGDRRVDYNLDSTGRPINVKTDETVDGGGNLLSYCESDFTYDEATNSNGTYSHGWLAQIANT